MRFYHWIFAIAGLSVAAICGLAAGISLNPESTVRFVIIWGDANAWAMWGTWAGAAFTAGAVWLSLYYSRHDDKEMLTLISEVHQKTDLVSTHIPKMTLRVVCTGRLPTTILAIGIGSARHPEAFYPVARYTTSYDQKKHLSRGEIVEATFDLQALAMIANDFHSIAGKKAKDLRFLVNTGLSSYSERFSPEAIATFSVVLNTLSKP